MTQSLQCKRRVDWVDCAKAMVLFLVIIGHTIGGGPRGKVVRGMIASFHMPLFFILSGLTFRPSQSVAEFVARTKRVARHLLIPVAVCVCLKTVQILLDSPENMGNLIFWRERVYLLLLGNCQSKLFYSVNIPRLGIPWFLTVLFFGRTMYDYICVHFNRGQSAAICGLASLTGYAIGQQGYLPLSIDIACVVLPCFCVGDSLKQFDFDARAYKRYLVFAAVWLFTLWLTFPNYMESSYLDLAYRKYPLYPLCFICAFFGSMAFFGMSSYISKFKQITEPLIYIGRNTLYLLLIHHFDDIWKVTWYMPEHEFVAAARRVFADIIVFTVFMPIKTSLTKLLKKCKVQ